MDPEDIAQICQGVAFSVDQLTAAVLRVVDVIQDLHDEIRTLRTTVDRIAANT